MKWRARPTQNANPVGVERRFLKLLFAPVRVALGRITCSLVLGGVLCPSLANATERVLDIEMGVRGSPKTCDNPYEENGTVKVLTGDVKYDEHGHPTGEVHHENEDHDNSSNCHEHPKWTGAFSYTYAHEFEGDHQEDTNFVGPRMEEEESGVDEEEHGGHPAHRFRAQFLKAFDWGEIGPSLELGIPKKGIGPYKLGLGAFAALHVGSHHELSAMARFRFGLQEGAGSDWELGGFYSVALFKYLRAGANILAEGHRSMNQREAHWGLGPTLGLRFGRFGLNAELVVGPGEKYEDDGRSLPPPRKRDRPWVHAHFMGTFYFGGAVGHAH